MKKVLIIAYSNIKSDPRVMRQIQLLSEHCELIVSGFGKKPFTNIDFVEIDEENLSLTSKLKRALYLVIGFFNAYYWGLKQNLEAKSKLLNLEFDIILANDLDTLPLALIIADGKPVILDAHEYTPKEFEDRWRWRLLFRRYYDYLCRQYLSEVSLMTTVCQGIADEYLRVYCIPCRVVHNAPYRQALKPTNIDPAQIRLVHHGACSRSRYLELMIEMMRYVDDRFSLDLMLIENDLAYLAELKKLALNDNRIRFIEPVPMPDISRRINDYDIGIYLLPPVNFNSKHALPNKFFEFIQARLAVAIGPSPEMASLVKKYKCGVVADSFEPRAFASTLNAIDAEVLIKYKHASDVAANHLNFENSANVMLEEIYKLS